MADDKTYSLYEFIEPFIEDIIQLYPEKTYKNKAIVSALCVAVQSKKIKKETIEFFVPGKLSKVLIGRLEILFRSYHEWNHLNKIYPRIFPSFPEYSRPHVKYRRQIINKYYGNLPKESNKEESVRMFKKMRELFDTKKYYDDAISEYMTHIADGIVPDERRKKIELDIHSYYPKAEKCSFNFSGLDFRGIDFSSHSHQGLVTICFANCNFSGGKYSTICLHQFYGCGANFTDFTFGERHCMKHNDFTGANFTRCNVTSLFYNRCHNKWNNINITDAYYIEDGVKMYGKHLVSKMVDKDDDDLGIHYSSPKDGGYNCPEFNPDIWQIDSSKEEYDDSDDDLDEEDELSSSYSHSDDPDGC